MYVRANPNIARVSSADFTKKSRETSDILKALNKSQAVIEFDVDGTIIEANQNFLDVMGYSLE